MTIPKKDMQPLFEHFTATDVIRVSGSLRKDPGGGARGNARVRALHVYKKKPDGVHRIPEKRNVPLRILFSSAVVVEHVENDALKLYALAAELFPPSDGVTGVKHALSVGLMMPRNEDSVSACLTKMGVTAPADIVFFQQAIELGPPSAARIASDPRFAAMLAMPRSAPTNVRVKNALDRARAWAPDADVQAACVKTKAPPDASIPLFLKPVPPTPLPPAGSYSLPSAPTGVYGPVNDRHGNLPRVFVRRAGDVSEVVAYARDAIFSPGAGKLPRGENLVPYQWYPPNLSLADTFATRLESAVYDGECEWSDADLRQALGLAKRVQWAFKDPNGDRARELYDRVRAKTGVGPARPVT